MNKNDYIAYIGELFTVEWYFDENNYSQPLEYLMNLTPEMQQKAFYLFRRIADNGKINDKTKFNNEGDKIFAFKPQPYRFLSFFVKDKKIIIANAFIKKTNKLPKNEKIKALKNMKEYIIRTNEGKYYEKQ
jgi:phage-related protein